MNIDLQERCNMTKTAKKQIAVALLGLLLTACGGGGGSSDTNSTTQTSVQSSLNSEESISTLGSDQTVDIMNQTESLLPTMTGAGDSSSTAETIEENEPQTIQGNAKPIAYAGEDKSTKVNVALHIEGMGTDSDGEIVAYEWKIGERVLASTVSFDYTPKEEDALPTAGARVDTLVLTVTDDAGMTNKDMVNITVLAE